MIITEYKPIGTTCGELIKKYKNEKKAYAGILDPMAHGLLTILTDNDISKMDEYMKKDKVYKFKFIIGTNTDTDDILGIHVLDSKKLSIDLKLLIDCFNNFPCIYKQKYHAFSAYKPKKKFEGKRKPMWWWITNGYEISEEVKRTVKIYAKKIEKVESISGEKLQKEFINRIELIKEDKFRKGETIKQWKEYEFNQSYDVFNCVAHVSSGFYIRQFVKDISDMLGVKLLVVDIERIAIS